MGKLLVLSFLVLVCFRGFNGCLEEERKALLALKEDFVEPLFHDDYDNSDDHSVLPSWINNPQSDCCQWERVTCNSTTGHVIELSLDKLRLCNPWEETISASWKISLFQPFEQLRILNLSFNCLPDWNTTTGILLYF